MNYFSPFTLILLIILILYVIYQKKIVRNIKRKITKLGKRKYLYEVIGKLIFYSMVIWIMSKSGNIRWAVLLGLEIGIIISSIEAVIICIKN